MPPPSYAGGRSRAFTLVELMVSSAIALTVIAAVATMFTVFSRTASDSRALADIANRIRQAAGRLREDLAGVTVPLKPPLDPGSGAGYFELVEGPATDYFQFNEALPSPHPLQPTGTASSLLGDIDDLLLFTTRSPKAPFSGRYGASLIESPVAEVAWFCGPARSQPVPGLRLYNLYRRQFLVVGAAGAGPFLQSGTTNTGDPFWNNPSSVPASPIWISPQNIWLSGTVIESGTVIPRGMPSLLDFHRTFDVSAYNLLESTTFAVLLTATSTPLHVRTSTNTLVPNTLADLTVSRQNRFPPYYRTPQTFVPFVMETTTTTLYTLAGGTTTRTTTYSVPRDGLTLNGTDREGEDVILTNVIGFDVRVFDPDAVPMTINSTAAPILPHEFGYVSTRSSVTQSVSAASISVDSTAGFPTTSGTLRVGLHGGAVATVTYGAISGNSFTGCSTLATGTVLPGNIVIPVTSPVRGGFIDLGCLFPGRGSTVASGSASGVSTLSGPGPLLSGAAGQWRLLRKANATDVATYDTWSTHFERNGLDDDNDLGADQGSDGDDVASAAGGIQNLPDDESERELPPPYATPLRAIEVRIRCYDPTTKAVRQITVRHQFPN